jgi:hypothetical protein
MSYSYPILGNTWFFIIWIALIIGIIGYKLYGQLFQKGSL